MRGKLLEPTAMIDISNRRWVTVAVALVVAMPPSRSLVAGEVTLVKKEDRIVVSLDEELFTQYRFEGFRKPVLHPLSGPGGIRMNRAFPFEKNVPGEADDHPHHQSLWFGHGDVNGVDFWTERKGSGKIVHKELVSVKGDTVVAKNDWLSGDGKVVCSDTRTLSFGGDKDVRWIDYQVTVHSSSGELTFGDTKEGTMALRTHPNLRLKNDPKRGVTTAGGQVLSSTGKRGPGLWGKPAKWLDYWGKIDGRVVGIAVFDHPSNLRHPTTWHARDYGLIAANPFGYHDFLGKPEGEGDFVLKGGASLTFRYRFVFHKGDPMEADIAEIYKDWSE